MQKSDIGRGAALIALIAGGCADPSVAVVFEVPAAQREWIAQVALQVLVPPAAAPFSCDDVAFQEVARETIGLSRVQEVVLPAAEGALLGGIPRTGDKLFFALGMDEGDEVVVAGCAPLGDVEASVEVTIAGEPTTRTMVPELALGEPLPAAVPVLVTDARAQPLYGIEVRSSVVGPAGQRTDARAVTDVAGEAVVAPPPSNRPGPVLLDVRVRWDQGSPPRLLGFEVPSTIFTGDLPGTAGSTQNPRTEALYQVGRVGPQGQVGFAALGPAASLGDPRQAFVAYYDPTAVPGPFRASVSAPLANVGALGLVRRDGRDRPVALSPSSWIEISSEGTITESPSPAPGRVVVRLAPGGACGVDAGTEVLLASFIDGDVEAFDATRRAIASPFAGNWPRKLSASGCAADEGGIARRTVLFSQAGLEQTIAADMSGLKTGLLGVFGAGVGFAPALGGAAARLLGTTLELDGTTIARHRLVDAGGPELGAEIETEDDAPSVPLSTAGGDVDGDGLVDVVALLQFGEQEGLTEFRILVALGAMHDGERIRGVSPTASGLSPRLFLADFDEDGVDDVLIATATGFAILRMGSP